MTQTANPPKATIDFESRSACPIDVGAWLYSKHPTTEPLCLAYKLPGQETKLWTPGFPQMDIEASPFPQDLMDWIEAGGLVEAHNSFFETCIWNNIMVPLYGWSPIRHEQWRCSAAKASYYALPRSLEAAVKSIKLPIEKDMEGNKVMRKVVKPRKPLKKDRAELSARGIDPDSVILWHENRDEYLRVFDYCVGDVEAEHAFSESLPDLPEKELRIWQMNQAANMRGIRCDLAMVKAAIKLRDRAVAALNAELCDITGGVVKTATSRAAFRDWMNVQGVELPDTQGVTLDKFVARKLPPHLHAAVSIVRAVNRTSTAKYDAMLEACDPEDWRLRDLIMYHGAGRTGRFAGKTVQPHNFPRGDVKDIDDACQFIIELDEMTIRALYGEVMKHLSDCLRGALTASEGKTLMVADFAAIEARVVFWLARDENALRIFRNGEDIYCDMATGVYGYPVKKKTHPGERQFGKQGILGLGFEMGFVTFLLTCKKYNITFTEQQVRKIVKSDYARHQAAIEKYLLGDKRRIARLVENEIDHVTQMHELVLMKHTVDTYRSRYPDVAQMWRDQEEAAMAAVRNPGRAYSPERGRVTWIVEEVGTAGTFLRCYLPSGKPLHYYDPRVVMKKTPWKHPDGSPVLKPELTFMGVDPYTRQWTRMGTYGGNLVENITQATARELMADAMVRCDEHPDYDVLLSVHDELIAEGPVWPAEQVKQKVREFEEMMSHAPGWAAGCPIEAEGWSGFRYRK